MRRRMISDRDVKPVESARFDRPILKTRALIHVPNVALVLRQSRHIFRGAVSAHRAVKFYRLLERHVDILRPTRGVAAHIEMRAFLKPGPEFRAALHHSVLNKSLFGLIA